jgi:cytochrome c peroxidase
MSNSASHGSIAFLLACAAPVLCAFQSAAPKSTGGGGVLAASAPPSLDTVPVPRPANLAAFIKDEGAAVRLGKTLLWDQQLGSDGRTACASCHHAAGVDSRAVNTMNPGGGGTLDVVPAGGLLRPAAFPIAGDDVVGSQGVLDMDFVHINPGVRIDTGVNTPNPVFGPNPQVTGRQAPTYINAIFNEVFFWDGRAANTFDGRTVGNAGVPVLQAQPDGSVLAVLVSLTDSAAASQAVGPPNSDVEMAWAGRTFPDIGKKMLRLRPLATQVVHPQDSLLSALRHPSGRGLAATYAQLIRAAFVDSWWDSAAVFDRAGNRIGSGAPVGLDQFNLMESNFSLFFGLAVQMYEATQVSPNSPFDRFVRGDAGAMSPRQQLGMELFHGKAGCNRCHGGSEFTNASVNVGGNGRAFAFIGVDPLAEDPGNADGEFKVPTVRNTELTGPYFHNGKYLTLRQVVDFYDRGGDVANDEIDPLGLTLAEKEALVDFLVALTDDDVRFQRGLFDHPSLNPVNRPPLAAVGRNGSAAPLRPFLGVSPFNPGPNAGP